MESFEDQVSELMRNQKHILEAIKYLNERIDIIDKTKDDKSGEVENILESQAMLDQIIVKNSDDILLIKKTKDANAAAIKHLETKIEQIDNEIEETNMTRKDKRMRARNTLSFEKSFTTLKCNICDENFERYSDLENHIKTCHGEHKLFQCNQCEKNFVLKWRLGKHMKLHNENNIKNCHYFNNMKECPFEILGCKFLHTVAEICQFGQRCQRRLCPLRHTLDKRVAVNDTEDVEEVYIDENDTTSADNSFATSTPQKTRFDCEDCKNKSQCIDCYVRQDNRHVHFSDDN